MSEAVEVFAARTLLQICIALRVDFWTLDGRIPPERQLRP